MDAWDLKSTKRIAAEKFFDKVFGDEAPRPGDDSLREPLLSPLDFIPVSGGLGRGAMGILGNEIGAVGKIAPKIKPTSLADHLDHAFGRAETFDKLMQEKLGPKWDEILRMSEEPTHKQLRDKWGEIVNQYAGLVSDKLKDTKKAVALGGAAVGAGALTQDDAEASGKVAQLVKMAVKKGATGLESEEAARMARATKMGFDTSRPYYHGTSAPIEEFKPSLAGSSTGAPDAKAGFFFTEDPTVADAFANYGKGPTMKDYLQKQKELRAQYKTNVRVDPRGGDAVLEDHFNNMNQLKSQYQPKLDELARNNISAENVEFPPYTNLEGANIIPSYLKTKNPLELPPTNTPDMDELATIIANAKAKGHDSLIIPNHVDDAKSVVVFDPSQIRSKFAKFNPDDSGSGNISAALGALGLGAQLEDPKTPQPLPSWGRLLKENL